MRQAVIALEKKKKPNMIMYADIHRYTFQFKMCQKMG